MWATQCDGQSRTFVVVRPCVDGNESRVVTTRAWLSARVVSLKWDLQRRADEGDRSREIREHELRADAHDAIASAVQLAISLGVSVARAGVVITLSPAAS